MRKRLKKLIAVSLATTMVSSCVTNVAGADVDRLGNEGLVMQDDLASGSAMVTTSGAAKSLPAVYSDVTAYANGVEFGDFDQDGDFDEADLTAIYNVFVARDDMDTTDISDETSRQYVVQQLDVMGYVSTGFNANNVVGIGDYSNDLTNSQLKSAYGWLEGRLHNGRIMPNEVGETYRWGDINGDGRANFDDQELLMDITLGFADSPGISIVDLNNSGYAEADDASILLQAILDYETSPLDRIEVQSPKTSYYYGDAIEDLTVRAHYVDGTYRDIKVSEASSQFTVSPTYFDTTGDVTVTVNYQETFNGFTIYDTDTFDVTVSDRMVDLYIDTPPNKTSYYAGDIFDRTGMIVKAVYESGAESVVTNYTYPTGELSTSDTYVTISYNGYTARQPITVNAVVPVGIEISQSPAKTAYIEGETFDPTDMEVEAIYNNGDRQYITNWTYDNDPLTLGQTTVTVYWDEFTTVQRIRVTETQMTGISIDTPPNKTSYVEGNTFDPTGMVVYAHYDNGTSVEIDDYTYPTDELATTDTYVTISYSGFTANQSITVRERQLVGIEIAKAPNKTEYVEGQCFVPAGSIVMAQYDNGDEEEILDYNYHSDPFQLGDDRAWVEYEGFYAYQSITVIELRLTGIEIYKAPDTTTYIEGQSFDDTGMVVRAIYNNGNRQVVTDYTYPSGELVYGQTEVAVSYGGYTAYQIITVRARQMIGIQVAVSPDKENYIEGETFDPTGMIIEAVYDNGDEEEVTGWRYPLDELTLGQDRVEITYGGFSTYQGITVRERQMTGISIQTPPNKVAYIEGNTFDPEGMVVQAHYDNGDIETVTGYTYPEGELTLGQTSITIEFNGFEAEQDITVRARKMVGIRITAPPTKTTYIERTEFDPAGMEVVSDWDNGDVEAVTDYVTTPATLTLDNEFVTVQFNGFEAQQEVSVVPRTLIGIIISAPPTQTEYIERTMFNPEGMIVTAQYDNGENEAVTDYTTTPSSLVLGNEYVTISYEGFEVRQPVSVVPRTLIGLAIMTPPDKLTYVERTEFDKTGMQVQASYDNGEKEIVEDYTTTPSSLVLGDTHITVEYGGLTVEQPVTVMARKLIGIAITREPDKTEYIENTLFDSTGMEVQASYDNGEVEVIEDYTTSPSAVKLGDTFVEVAYEGFTAQQEITVVARKLIGIAITKAPDKTEYIENTLFDRTGMEVTAEYDNGETEVVEDYTTTPSAVQLGDTFVEIAYNGFTAQQLIDVLKKSIISAEIITPPNDTEYNEGETFDPEGMVVEVEYDNGETETRTDYTYPTEPLTEGQTGVEIGIEDITLVQPVTVYATTESTTETTTESTESTTTSVTESTESTTEPTTESTESTTEPTTESTESTTASVTESATESTTSSLTESTESTTGATTETVTESVTESTTAESTEVTTATVDSSDDTTETTTSRHNVGGGSSGGSGGSSSGSGNSSDKATSSTSGSGNNGNANDSESGDRDDDNTGEGTGSGDGSGEGTGSGDGTGTADTDDTDMFIDISDNYARDYINDLARRGILSGYSDSTYKPSASTKRGDFAVVIAKLMGYTGFVSADFTDVPATSYYASYIALTTQNDTMIGYGDGTFKPEDTLSREEMFVIVAKVSGVDVANANESVLNNFSDGSNVADWAKPYTAALVSAGIVNGDNGSLRPQDNITRAEMAVLVAQIAG